MYRIGFYENGVFCTDIGGELSTLSQALEQIQSLSRGLEDPQLVGCVGVKFDRCGTPCALVVLDGWGFPIKDAKTE
jgi:hypothetical protein